MSQDELLQALVKTGQDQTEALKAGFREMALLGAERNSLLAKQNAIVEAGVNDLIAVIAEAFEVELEDENDEGDGSES